MYSAKIEKDRSPKDGKASQDAGIIIETFKKRSQDQWSSFKLIIFSINKEVGRDEIKKDNR